MILFELTETENDPVYQGLEYSNSDRQLQFLESMVSVALSKDRPVLSQTLIKALNFHAIACLHINAGEYRPCEVNVGTYTPPRYFQVPALMDDFVNIVNLHWDKTDPIELAASVLWRLNYIHPFINGNGRTARACCYFVLCVKVGRWIPGSPILPALLKKNRDEYVGALREVDDRKLQGHPEPYEPLCELIGRLLVQQVTN